MIDLYKTVTTPSPEVLFKDRGSKFYGYVFPLLSEENVNDCIAPIRKKYPKAGHHCYSYRIGPAGERYRANDDGEPSHSAGDPILGQLVSYDVSDVLVVVTRIFGGTKLGVGGLINAYRETAKLALDASTIIEKKVTKHLIVTFGYEQMSPVMRLIKEKNLTIVSQKLEATCAITLDILLNDLEDIKTSFELIYPVTATIAE